MNIFSAASVQKRAAALPCLFSPSPSCSQAPTRARPKPDVEESLFASEPALAQIAVWANTGVLKLVLEPCGPDGEVFWVAL